MENMRRKVGRKLMLWFVSPFLGMRQNNISRNMTIITKPMARYGAMRIDKS